MRSHRIAFDHRSRDRHDFSQDFYIGARPLFIDEVRGESLGLESSSWKYHPAGVSLSGTLAEGYQEYLFGPRQQSYYVGTAEVFYLVANQNFNLTTPGVVVVPPAASSSYVNRKVGTTYVWKDNTGSFMKTGDRQWTEYHPNGNRIVFEEVNDAPMYVEMIDRSRDISVRLYAGAMHLRQPGESEFRFFRDLHR